MRANVTSFFPHDTHTTLTKDHLQASRVVCHLANHDADIATYVTGQHKVCSHHSVKKDQVLISHTAQPCLALSSTTYYQSKDQDDSVQRRLHEIIIWYNTDDINDMCLSSTALSTFSYSRYKSFLGSPVTATHRQLLFSRIIL